MNSEACEAQARSSKIQLQIRQPKRARPTSASAVGTSTWKREQRQSQAEPWTPSTEPLLQRVWGQMTQTVAVQTLAAHSKTEPLLTSLDVCRCPLVHRCVTPSIRDGASRRNIGSGGRSSSGIAVSRAGWGATLPVTTTSSSASTTAPDQAISSRLGSALAVSRTGWGAALPVTITSSSASTTVWQAVDDPHRRLHRKGPERRGGDYTVADLAAKDSTAHASASAVVGAFT